MMNKIITLLFIISIVIIQVSFLTTWPNPIRILNLVLSLVIFIAVLISYNKGLYWAFTAGLLLELFSGQTFGVVTIGMILTVMIINFLFNNFFTNKSLYSLIFLGLIGTIIYNLIILSFHFLLILIRFNEPVISVDLLSYFIWQPILNLLVLIVIFFTYYISTGRLKNIFLFS